VPAAPGAFLNNSCRGTASKVTNGGAVFDGPDSRLVSEWKRKTAASSEATACGAGGATTNELIAHPPLTATGSIRRRDLVHE